MKQETLQDIVDALLVDKEYLGKVTKLRIFFDEVLPDDDKTFEFGDFRQARIDRLNNGETIITFADLE